MPLIARPRCVRAAAVVALFFLSAAQAAAEVRVIDGDTFETETERVRLFGIDAPESDQPGGAQAADALRRLIGKADPKCTEIDRDRYGRMVALCSIGGVDLSLAMVRAGHAVSWCYYLQKQRPDLLSPFRAAEAAARQARRGIWQSNFAPWRDWGCSSGRVFTSILSPISVPNAPSLVLNIRFSIAIVRM